MKELLLQILIFSYASLAIIETIAYWPTIKDLYYHKKQSANTKSYMLWTGTNGIALPYAIFILPDTLFRIISGLSFSACAIILILSLKLEFSR